MDNAQDSARHGQDTVTSRFIIKWLIAAVIICGGVGGGIYAGFALSDNGYGRPSEDSTTNTTLLEIGETFPDYDIKNFADSKTMKISDLTANGPALLVFVSASCEACIMMDRYWEKRVVKHFDPDIQLIWVYDSWEEKNKGFDTTALREARVITTDRSKQMLTDGINGTPTFVGLDKNNKIALIVNGFDKNIDADYFNDRL